jgi:hypothetical protein
MKMPVMMAEMVVEMMVEMMVVVVTMMMMVAETFNCNNYWESYDRLDL